MLDRTRHPSLELILLVTDIGLSLLALHLARLTYWRLPGGIEPGQAVFSFSLWHYLIVALIWGLVFITLGTHDLSRILRHAIASQDLFIAITAAILLFAGINYFFFREFSRFLFVYFYILAIVFLFVWRSLLQSLLRWQIGSEVIKPRRVLIVGVDELAQRIRGILDGYRWVGIQVVGHVDSLSEAVKTGESESSDTNKLASIIKLIYAYNVTELIITLPSQQAQALKQSLWDTAVNVHIVSDVSDMLFVQAMLEGINPNAPVSLYQTTISGMARLSKRLFDLLFGTILLLLALPLMLIIAVLIKLDSPGSIFFVQERVGERGRLFKMFKFRTMVDGAEAKEKEYIGPGSDGYYSLLKQKNDPRVTGIGRFLRRFSLDELPQLLNVLKGDMSLVGPRPELPWLVEHYEPWQRKRLAVPQGLTGWWQIQGRSERSDQLLRVADDLYYIYNYSPWLDLHILLMTIWVVIKGTGAY